jgi:diguanylate cyclase (GGDEF)-like protein/PAS domain S-box-containing protein
MSIASTPDAGFLAAALQSVAVAAIATDTEGAVTFWNAAAETLYGYTGAEALGHSLNDLIIPSAARASAVRLQDAIRAGEHYSADWPAIDKFRREFTAFITVSAVSGADGKVIGMLGLSHDVTARREAEAHHRTTAAIVEGSADAILQSDLDGVVVHANRAVEGLFGYTPEELIGNDVRLLIPAERVGELATSIEAAGRGEDPPPLTTQRLRKDGTAIDVSVQLSRVFGADGELVGLSALTRDVTDALRTKRALESSEHRFRDRFDKVHLPQAVTTLEGEITDVNNALCQLIGLPRKDLVGSHVSSVRHPTDPTPVDEGFSDRWGGATGTARTWERILRKGDGSPLPVLIQATRLAQDDGPDVIAEFLQDLTQLRATQETLNRREAVFAALESHASEWALIVDGRARIRYVSPSVMDALGFDPDDVVGRLSREFVHPDDHAGVSKVFRDVRAAPGRECATTIRVPRHDGTWRWVEYIFTNRLEDPDIAGIVLNGRDVTARIEAERALRDSESRYRAIAETAQEGIWTIDGTGGTVFANQKLADILGRSLQEIHATTVAGLLNDRDSAFVNERLLPVAGRITEDHEVSYVHPDGGERILQLIVSPLSDNNGSVGSLVMVSDVTAAREAERQLRHQALHDELTGLANRSLLQDRLTQATVRVVRHPGASVAVLFADIDQFKMVNDTWGHATGDELLRQVAQRLVAAVRDSDSVARFGGDEFVVVAEDTNEDDAVELAKRMLSALAHPFVINSRRLYVSASIGVATSPPHSGDDLLRFADAAMYDAKARGRGRVQRFDRGRNQQTADRLLLSNDLRDALTNDELMLFYQPLVDLGSGAIVGVEALARWTHHIHGDVPPSVFVPVAEAMGLATELDQWVLRRACSELARLRQILGRSIRVSVNISASHIGDPQFERHVVAAFAEVGVGGQGLVLEITETALMSDPNTACSVLERLRAQGIQIAIDDFGTGYSSLGYLSKLPVDMIKIDRAFVTDITDDPDALALASSIIELSRTLRLSTTAEGVETNEQLTLLHRLGCVTGQGYLWSRALPIDELDNLVRSLPGRAFRIAAGRLSRLPRSSKHGVVTADHGLQLIMRMHRDGASLTSIAAALNSGGFRTPEGTQWHRATVARVMSDGAYPASRPALA